MTKKIKVSFFFIIYFIYISCLQAQNVAILDAVSIKISKNTAYLTNFSAILRDNYLRNDRYKPFNFKVDESLTEDTSCSITKYLWFKKIVLIKQTPSTYQVELVNCENRAFSIDTIIPRINTDGSMAEAVDKIFLSMVLKVDTSLYHKITRFDEVMADLPEKDRERHAHYYFCITKKDYIAGHEFCRKNFSNPHYNWADPNSVAAIMKVSCDTFKYQTCKDNNSICLDYDGSNLELDCLSNYLLERNSISTIRLTGKWDTTSLCVNKLRNIRNYEAIKNIKIIKIIQTGTGLQERNRVERLTILLKSWYPQGKITILDRN